jgi:hypothetical protein
MDITQQIQAVLERLEVGAAETRAELAGHASRLAAELAVAATEPGYDRAVRHARGQLLAHAGLELVEAADEADRLKVEALVGALTFAAEVLAA